MVRTWGLYGQQNTSIRTSGGSDVLVLPSDQTLDGQRVSLHDLLGPVPDREVGDVAGGDGPTVEAVGKTNGRGEGGRDILGQDPNRGFWFF